MSRSPSPTLAVNADFADALLTARRFKGLLFWLLLLLLLIQLGIFFAVRFSDRVKLESDIGVDMDMNVDRGPAPAGPGGDGTDNGAPPTGDAAAAPAVGPKDATKDAPKDAAPPKTDGTAAPAPAPGTDDPTKAPAGQDPTKSAAPGDPGTGAPGTGTPGTDTSTSTPKTGPADDDDMAAGGTDASSGTSGGGSMSPSTSSATVSDQDVRIAVALEYVTGLVVFLGLVLSVVLVVIVLLMVLIMLAGRMIGVSHVVSAFCWAVVLTVLLFPWQAFFYPSLPTGTRHMGPAPSDFSIPGALYTWSEVESNARFNMPGGPQVDMPEQILRWARFVGFPVVAMLILIIVQTKSGRGTRYALGEADVQVNVNRGDM